MSRPTIQEALKIEVEKSGENFRADAKVFPGMPSVGIGKTEYEALFDLLAKIMWDGVDGGSSGYFKIAINKMREAYRKFMEE